MSAVKSIMLAIVVATRKRDQAEKSLVYVQRSHAFALSQLHQLESYAVETDGRWTVTAQGGTVPELIRHHYQFMDRLHHAISLQKDAVQAASQRVDSARKGVVDAEVRLAGLKQMLQKKQADAARVEMRRDQKQMDEFAAIRIRHAADGCI